MIKKKLSHLHYLKKEIKEQQNRIKKLKAAATSCAGSINGLPCGAGVFDKIRNYAAQIADLKSLLDLILKKSFYELNRLNRYIQSVENSQMRMILTLKYVNGLTWRQIAKNMGASGDGSTKRKKLNRFLKHK